MCGIVGVLTIDTHAEEKAYASLKHLEYRGYDSFGFISESFKPQKHKGAISKTEERDLEFDSFSEVAMAHTRWATHGEVSISNTHPHVSMRGLFAVVHNGVISNYKDLKLMLMSEGYTFESSTDTEVVSNLLEYLHLSNLEASSVALVRELILQLKGEFALCILGKPWEGKLLCTKNKSPLCFASDSSQAFIASDEIALSSSFEHCVHIEDCEILELSKREGRVHARLFGEVEVDFTERDTPIFRKPLENDLGEDPNYMWKEMLEIPNVLDFASKMISDLSALKSFLKDRRVVLTGCGSAYYACQLGHYLRKIELPGSETLSFAADEIEHLHTFRQDDVLLCVSQSGETFDTLEPARRFKAEGGTIVAITNVQGSSLDNLADFSVVQNAGIERCVLSTKSIVSQCAIMYALFSESLKASGCLKVASVVWEDSFKRLQDNIEAIASMMFERKTDHVFFVGRGLYNAVAMENALKLKEVTYCHAEGMGAGFFKHGTLSLIDERFVTFAHLPSRTLAPELYELTLANIEEIRARNGHVILIGHDSDCDIKLTSIDQSLDALLHLGVGQFLAYHFATKLGRDVDQPRSLAKSVTVR